jgi:heat shock protein HtpX
MNIFFSTYYKLSKYLSSIVLLTGMLALLSLIGWLLAGTSGMAVFLPGGVFIFISALRITPRLILRLHQAKVLQPKDAPLHYEIVAWLAMQAGMKNMPTLYYIPSRMINALYYRV